MWLPVLGLIVSQFNSGTLVFILHAKRSSFLFSPPPSLGLSTRAPTRGQHSSPSSSTRASQIYPVLYSPIISSPKTDDYSSACSHGLDSRARNIHPQIMPLFASQKYQELFPCPIGNLPVCLTQLSKSTSRNLEG